MDLYVNKHTIYFCSKRDQRAGAGGGGGGAGGGPGGAAKRES